MEVDLGRADLDAVRRPDEDAALRVRFLRVAVELRRGAHHVVCQAVRPEDRQLHALERVPSGWKRHDALRAVTRGDAAGDRLRVLERLRLEPSDLLRTHRRGYHGALRTVPPPRV